MNFNHVPFYEIVERIKDIISNEVDGKVYDYHVAEALGLSTNSIRMYKSINFLPLEQLMVFCSIRKISCDWLIFGRKI